MEAKRSETVVQTFCGRKCHGACGILVTVRDGKAIKLKGDPECSMNRGALCAKEAASLDILYHPSRLRYPHQRIGERGEGRWKRISWDEALESIAQRLNEIKRAYGPESVVLALGSPKGLEVSFALRLSSVFGTPNVVTPGHICHMPRVLASATTYGSTTIPDYSHPPSCLVLWGSNLLQTNEGGITRAQLRPALRKGTKLIVIDPRKTNLAAQADLWLKPRPGSDGALALAIIKLIVEQRLYDEEFVSNWTAGFDLLKERVDQRSLSELEEITWVPAAKIEEMARLYATTKPAAIQWGNAIDHTINSFQTARAICILRAITGNLDVPGGDTMLSMPPLTRPGRFMLLRQFPRDQEKMLGNNFKLAARSLMVARQAPIKAILTQEPYPIKGACFFATNPLLSYANAREVFEALRKLEFSVVAELFMTPTAELADIVLPAATSLEFDEIGHYGLDYGFITARSKAIEPVGECWSDIKIINELAKRLGFGEQFWNDVEESLDHILEPSGLTFEELKKVGMLWGDKKYRSYAEEGFKTPSGKAELYSHQLEEMGYDPLPVYNEPPETPYGSPELAKEYPLILTNAKEPSFIHSSYRSISRLRKLSPEPLAQLNPDTAKALLIEDGDWVYIETRRGRIKQRASLNDDIDPRVVVAAYGWWFPEREASSFYGWDESNVNILTGDDPPFDPALGSTNLRGLLCKVYKT